MNQLNAYMALEIMHDSVERAERERRARRSLQQPPTEGVRRWPGSRPLRRAVARVRRAPAAVRQ